MVESSATSATCAATAAVFAAAFSTPGCTPQSRTTSMMPPFTVSVIAFPVFATVNTGAAAPSGTGVPVMPLEDVATVCVVPGESETAPQFVMDSLHPSANVSAFAEVSLSPFAMSVPRTPNSCEIVTSAAEMSTGPVSFLMLIVAVSGLPFPFRIFVPASNENAFTYVQGEDALSV